MHRSPLPHRGRKTANSMLSCHRGHDHDSAAICGRLLPLAAQKSANVSFCLDRSAQRSVRSSSRRRSPASCPSDLEYRFWARLVRLVQPLRARLRSPADFGLVELPPRHRPFRRQLQSEMEGISLGEHHTEWSCTYEVIESFGMHLRQRE